jgi:acetoin utilization deacetylase AcuC-like enzyme
MPSRTGFVYHDRFLDHTTGPGHPERPDRLRSIVGHLKQTGTWAALRHLIIDEAHEEWILKVHTPEHYAYVRDAIRRGAAMLDQGDTRVSSESYRVALLAAGGVLAAVDAVVGGLLDNAFCAIRPPGHHAERNAVMGFCLFNNIAIGARYAQQQHGIKRVAIVDWDVHHGNGTQDIFYEDPSVLFVSLHQSPFYPGTGSRDERGSGPGIDCTLNIPLRAGSTEDDYVQAFHREILPTLDVFRPDLIMISAGFDAHRDDPLANMELTAESFAAMTSLLAQAANRYCNGHIVSVLEGGYNLQALAESTEAHLSTLLA